MATARPSTLTDDAALAFARPVIDIAIPAGAAVDLTLRVGPMRVVAGAEEGEAPAFAGGAATDMPIEVGGQGFIPGFTEQMVGMAPGRQPRHRRDLPGRLRLGGPGRQARPLHHRRQGAEGAQARRRSTTTWPRPSAWPTWRR